MEEVPKSSKPEGGERREKIAAIKQQLEQYAEQLDALLTPPPTPREKRHSLTAVLRRREREPSEIDETPRPERIKDIVLKVRDILRGAGLSEKETAELWVPVSIHTDQSTWAPADNWTRIFLLPLSQREGSRTSIVLTYVGGELPDGRPRGAVYTQYGGEKVPPSYRLEFLDKNGQRNPDIDLFLEARDILSWAEKPPGDPAIRQDQLIRWPKEKAELRDFIIDTTHELLNNKKLKAQRQAAIENPPAEQ